MVEYPAKMQAAITKYRSLPEKITFSGATVKDRHPILNYEHANSIEEFAEHMRFVNEDLWLWESSSHKGSKLFPYYGDNVK